MKKIDLAKAHDSGYIKAHAFTLKLPGLIFA